MTVHTVIVSAAAFRACETQAQSAPLFDLQESTIEDIHDAIRAGDATCEHIVQGYVDRARPQRRLHDARGNGRPSVSR